MGTTISWKIINGQILDVFNQEFIKTDLWIDGEAIVYCGKRDDWQAQQTYDAQGAYIVPGFIDGHVHIESSLLTPSEFGRLSLQNGVTRIFADPHEIASVTGKKGIDYMLAASRDTPLHIHYMLPSSVPAAPFEHAGATLKAADLKPFYDNPQVNGLAEVMDYPAVANQDDDMLTKIKDAQAAGKHADGHGAGLTPAQLAVYRKYGIDTDHEASTAQEALDRVRAGFNVFIREGTVERDELALLPSITEKNEDRFSFATDDKTAGDIYHEGSINYNVKLALQTGLDPALVYKMASYNAAQAQHIDQVGAIAPGYVADLLIIQPGQEVKIEDVMVAGQWFENKAQPILSLVDRRFNFSLNLSDLALPLQAQKSTNVIKIMPHHITTKHLRVPVPVEDGYFVPNQDFAKVVVVERYHNLGYGLGIIQGLAIHQGAIASSIAHDSHNIIAAGDNDADIFLAIQTLKDIGGGQVVVHQGQITTLPLTIGGLMSDQPFETVIKQHQELLTAFSTLSDLAFDPFLTLSFMALPVIPSLKITDQGLFDFEQFQFIKIQEV